MNPEMPRTRLEGLNQGSRARPPGKLLNLPDYEC